MVPKIKEIASPLKIGSKRITKAPTIIPEVVRKIGRVYTTNPNPIIYPEPLDPKGMFLSFRV